jgi:hypothetical protein
MTFDPLIRLGTLSRNWAVRSNPWTNVYGLGRTLLAAGTATTLAFSSSSTLFRPAWGVPEFPICHGLSRIGLFCIGSHHLEITKMDCGHYFTRRSVRLAPTHHGPLSLVGVV